MVPVVLRICNFDASPLLLSGGDQCWKSPPHVVAVG
jgi:hypothetical protein